MKTISKIVGTMFGFVLLAGVGVGGYVALKLIVERFARIDIQVATVTAIGSVVALLVAVIIASSIRLASRQNKADQLHVEKAATYQLLLDAWESILRHGWRLDHQSPGRQAEDLHAVEQLLILYGAPGVVKAYGTLQALATKLGAHSPDVVSQFAKVLMEMRQDLGSDIQGLKAEDLMQLLQVESENSSDRPKAQLYQDLQPRVSLATNA